MACICSYNVRVVHCHKNPDMLPINPSLRLPDPGDHRSFYCLCSLVFSRRSYSWSHLVYNLFIRASSMSHVHLRLFYVFPRLRRPYFFLVLNDIPPPGWTTGYLPSPTEGRPGRCRVSATRSKAAMNIHVQVRCGPISFPLS